MSFNIKTISVFERQAKRLMKKFPSLKKEVQELIKELKKEPKKGISIGHNCYKIRLAIVSKGKGKSGGARIITHFAFRDDTVYLLTIYDKSDIENLTDKEILELIKLIP
ncbi:MAG TPA: type II toxin-antitoxin system RelE/ParE family toxin [Bacteroidetes bacterium]|jgi:mRNA-degrading endonuclease RelE of RelBE toxin-antitoxin system|nr:type II toxin-antitoxin system RelE/ParE family toxin [Bacteroidota bacterium]